MTWRKCYPLLLSALWFLLGTLQPVSAQTPAATIQPPAGRVLFVLSSQQFHGNSTLPAVISIGAVS